MSSEQRKSRRGPRRRPRRGKNKSPRPSVPRVRRSAIDTDRPADEPLTDDERKEMKRHLAFIKRYRAVLRPKLNAKEALMVEGAREPEHRGTCVYLLSKIDLRTIRAALEREPMKSDAGARARFLAEAAGITGDLGVLLRFLESLCEAASTRDAARAFTRAVGRIDFDQISAARLSRLLDVMVRSFPEHELPGALFGLLQNPGFRQAFDRNVTELAPELAARFVALRVVWEALPGGRRGRRGPRPDPVVLGEGLAQMLDAPGAMREAWPRKVRERLLACALDLGQDWVLDHPGIPDLLRSLPPDAPTRGRHGLVLARSLVRAGRLDDAGEILGELGSEADPEQAAELRRVIAAPRVGPLALLEGLPGDGLGLVRAFHLGRLGPVLARLGTEEARDAMEAECEVQAEVCLPGVAMVLECATPRHGPPWAVLSCSGRPLDELLADRRVRLSYADALALARAGTSILRALALVGLTLPDAHPRRFVVPGELEWGSLVLADLAGVKAAGQDAAGVHGHALAAAWCRDALLFPPFRGKALRREIPSGVKAPLVEALAAGAPPWDIARLLAKAG